jgi:branched-subunit amino acid aminotransferase/4-amino-4-deoxychorismate lyase
MKYDPDPIQVALALLPSSCSVSNLPSRKDSYPEAKLSAWCNSRRPLEAQFKREGVGEVLLVDADKATDIHLLEGLTSNVFVLYPGDVLRTAGTGVLHGYARQQVLAQAVNLGLTLDLDTPIRLDESDMWLECFVTSSVKLIAPVAQIMVPAAVAIEDEDGDVIHTTELEEVWSRGNAANSRSVWRELYNGIMLDHDTC